MQALVTRHNAFFMFAELAFIDWIALIVAAVLLAGAAASLVVVSVAARQRQRAGRPGPLAGPRALRAGPAAIMSRATDPTADVIELRRDRQSSGVSRAARADRLRRRRPQPDVPPPKAHDPGAEGPADARNGDDSANDNGDAGGTVLTMRHARRAQRRGFSPRQPGFFEDPIGKHELRYWDGSKWTEHVKEHGQRFTDPL